MDTVTSRGGEAGTASGAASGAAHVEVEAMPDGRTIRFYRAVVSAAGRHDDPQRSRAAEPQ